MKKLFLFALVATMFAACATDETRDVVTATTPETLTVSFEDADSRIQLQDGKTIWTQGDLVSVFYRSDANQKWQFQGETGDRTGSLKRIATVEATHELSNVVVVYPYNENYYINPKSCNIEASLPAEQTYLADSYGVGNNIMVSYGEYNQVVLKSVCGWLKVQLTGNGETVKSIKLKGNNGEQVAGQIYINSADATAVLASDMGNAEDEGSAGGNLVFEDTVLTEVTLNCGEGVTLGAEPTAFYIALPPQTFEKGLTIEIEDTDALKMTKSTDRELAISRNAIQPMSAFEFDGKRMPQNNEILYTATEKVQPSSANVFGANIISNEWDSTTKEGVITFDGQVTSIGDHAFSRCANLTNIAIPNSVTSIGMLPFYHCDNLATFYGKFASSDHRCLILDGELKAFASAGLTEYTVPNSVTSIGDNAFRDCGSLTSITISDSVILIAKRAFSGCSSLTSVTIPNSVISIGDRAFYDCSNLAAFYGKFASSDNLCLIINGVLNSFVPAVRISNYTIPNSVTSIEQYAFALCKGLEYITISDSVTSIGNSAFYNCSNLVKVYCKSVTPPSGGDGMFSINGVQRKIYVPRESVEAYKAADGWSDYANYIVGYDF